MEIKPVRINSFDMMRGVINDYWQEARQAPEKGRLVAWCTALTPAEILVAADIFTVFPENHCAACGAAKVGGFHCEVAEAHGYSIDVCSYPRNDLGSALAGKDTRSPVGGLPQPNLVVYCSNQCRTVIGWSEALGRLFNCPAIVVDVPFWHDWFTPDDTRTAVEYVKHQLEELVTVVEDITHKRFDYDRLRECLGYTRKLGTLWKEVLDLGRNIPAPLNCFDHFMWLFPIVVQRGIPDGIPCLQALKAEAEERIAQKVGTVPEEKYRLYWDNIAVWYKIRELFFKFASYGATPVTAAYPLNWEPLRLSDPARPLESMAEALFTTYINQGVGRRIEYITNLVKEFSVDGMVMQTSRSCKAFFIGQYDIVEAIQERLGVPSVLIEGDMVDPRVYSDAEVNSRIDALMSILTSRGPRQRQ